MQQREFFNTGRTFDLSYRDEQLKRLREGVERFESKLIGALKDDLGKSEAEAFVSEVGFVYDEIRLARKHLPKWAKPRRVPSPLLLTLARSEIRPEPLGVVLIMGPWNYPFQLVFAPLVGALAAGNCAVLKPSELAPRTSETIAEMVAATLDPGLVQVVLGGVEESEQLLAQPWDHIFFTGSTNVGRIVMTRAAAHLTPVTLELGGKSPCIVDKNTDLTTTARRIVWGKFFNAGQTCVAPDYLYVHRDLEQPLITEMKTAIESFYGKDPEQCADYGRIVSSRHFDRLYRMLSEGKVLSGGRSRQETRYIEPTLLTDVPFSASLLQEEIFGPLLPILSYKSMDEVIAFVRNRPKPLALYLFSKDQAICDRVLTELSFGGGCLNDTLIHLSNSRLPFGGVGESGMGAYHGKFSFDTFSHLKSVVRRSFTIDPALRYPPYRIGWMRKLFR